MLRRKDQGHRHNNFRGKGAVERQSPKNSSNKPPTILSERVRGRTGHAPTVHLKGTLHQEPYVKSKDYFLEKHPFSENAFFKKFMPSREKLGTKVPLP